jgi:thiamine-monophosphate kinase
MHLCKQSKVGCNLYEDKLPIDPQFINVCEEFNIDSTTVAINGGEDYELLTIAMEDFEKIKGNFNDYWSHDTRKRRIHLVTRAIQKLL